jgi:hypothetical protein
VDALEEQNDQCTPFLDPGKGEIFLLRLEGSRMIEEGYDEQSFPEWRLLHMHNRRSRSFFGLRN